MVFHCFVHTWKEFNIWLFVYLFGRLLTKNLVSQQIARMGPNVIVVWSGRFQQMINVVAKKISSRRIGKPTEFYILMKSVYIGLPFLLLVLTFFRPNLILNFMFKVWLGKEVVVATDLPYSIHFGLRNTDCEPTNDINDCNVNNLR